MKSFLQFSGRALRCLTLALFVVVAFVLALIFGAISLAVVAAYGALSLLAVAVYGGYKIAR